MKTQKFYVIQVIARPPWLQTDVINAVDVRDAEHRVDIHLRHPDGEYIILDAKQWKLLQGTRRVIVSVRGGVAYVDRCPKDVKVIIMDYDNLEDKCHQPCKLRKKSSPRKVR